MARVAQEREYPMTQEEGKPKYNLCKCKESWDLGAIKLKII